MRKTRISVAEAARNLDEFVNRVHDQNLAFELLKDGSPIARLVPANKQVCTGRELAKALSKTDLSVADAVSWHLDLQTARKSPKNPRDKWR